MKLQVLSDLHLEAHELPRPLEIAGDVLVLAGDTHADPEGLVDFLATLPATTPIVTVLGNHEFDRRHFDSVLPRFREAVAGFGNVHVLENESVQVDGVTFLGATLWTSMFDGTQVAAVDKLIAYFQMQGVRAVDLMAKHDKTVAWLRSAYRNEESPVVVTHMAPSLQSIHPKYAGSPINGFFASDLDDLIHELQPPLWIHGHMHDARDYHIGRTRVLCHPRGYPGENPAWDPLGAIVEI